MPELPNLYNFDFSLGSWHDGQSGRGLEFSWACDSTDQYIMAGSVGGSDETFNNGFHFSFCSVDAFRSHLDSLTW